MWFVLTPTSYFPEPPESQTGCIWPATARMTRRPCRLNQRAVDAYPRGRYEVLRHDNQVGRSPFTISDRCAGTTEK
jgi:hypothetical protein